MESTIIVSERDRPFWHIPLAALCLTISVGLIVIFMMSFYWSNHIINELSNQLFYTFYLGPIGIGLCTQRRVHIDLKKSRFRPTVEIGNFKFGSWKTIKNYEYVSVFQQLLQDGTTTFEVNIWFDTNKHYQLYERNDYLEAFTIGFNLSEELDIDLLDATAPNDYKWIDKDDWKQQMNEDDS